MPKNESWNDTVQSMLASQWADGKPDREAQVASVNGACQLAAKTLMANLKFNRQLLLLDTFAQLEDLDKAIEKALHSKYGAK